MLLTVFENNYFLLALGWGILNSLWQAGFLWLIYQLTLLSSRNISALFRYHLSLGLLNISFAWFAITTLQAYWTLDNSGYNLFVGVDSQWILSYQKFITAFQLISYTYLLLFFLNGIKFFYHFNSLLLLKKSQLLKAPVDIRIFVNQTATHLGIKKKVEVWLSKNVEVPCVTGYIKPIILLPFAALNNLSTMQAEAIILHELAHIKRNDYLVNLFQAFVELVLFFNPFAILLGKAARKERENCCDDWVLNYQYNKHDYATALMLLEEQRQSPVQLALAATSGKKQLLIRVKRLFNVSPSTNIGIWQKVRLVGIGCLALFTLIILFPKMHSQQTLENTFTNQAPAEVINISQNVLAANIETVKFKKIINKKLLPVEVAKISKPKPRKPINTLPREIEYSDALINEELLRANNQIQNISSLVAEKEVAQALEYLIKIEEENSGSKEKKSYLLHYKNDNGQLEIKPLIILNKSKALYDKVKKPAGTKSIPKKRITS